MTTSPPDGVAGLPDSGPATLPGTKAFLRIGPGDVKDDESILATVAAVNALVRSWPVAKVAAGAADWTAPNLAHVVLGADMLAGRLWRRRNSPAGVEVFGADGPAYVSRNDPDIARLLRLNLPAVG